VYRGQEIEVVIREEFYSVLMFDVLSKGMPAL